MSRLPGKLIGGVGDVFLLAAEAEGLAEEVALRTEFAETAPPPFCASPLEKPASPSVPFRPKPCASSGLK